MPSQKSRLDRELDRAAILLLNEAFPRNNDAKATASDASPDGNAAVPTTPDVAAKVRIFTAIADYRALRAKLDRKGDDDSPGTGTLSDLQRQLNGHAAGGRPGNAS